MGFSSEAEVDEVADLRAIRSEIRSLRGAAGSGMHDCGGSLERFEFSSLISRGEIELANRFRFPSKCQAECRRTLRMKRLVERGLHIVEMNRARVSGPKIIYCGLFFA